MKDNAKVQRFNMRIEGEFKKRLDALANKKGISATSVVREAIFEKYDREIIEADNGRRKKNL